MYINEEERTRYAEILEAYDQYLAFNNKRQEAEKLSMQLPLFDFDDVASALFDYDWTFAVELLTNILCTANSKADREIAALAIEAIETTYDIIGGKLDATAEHCIELGYLDLYCKLIQ